MTGAAPDDELDKRIHVRLLYLRRIRLRHCARTNVCFHSFIAPTPPRSLAKKKAEEMRREGLIRGGSDINAVLYDEDEQKFTADGGLRFDDEPVRHRLLDCLGDLSIVGYPIIANYRTLRPSHTTNFLLLRALFLDTTAFELVDERELLA